MKSRQSNLTIFAVLTTFTILTWVFVEAYQRFYKVELTTIPPKVISQLDPTLDSQTLNEILQRKQLSEQELSSLNPIKTAVTPISTEAQVSQPATPEAQVSQPVTPEASEGAEPAEGQQQ